MKKCKTITASERTRLWRENNPERNKRTRRAYYLANREKIISKSRAWLGAHPERKREQNRIRRWLVQYGITPADYAAMLELQGNQCAICPARLTNHRDTHVDHSHASGKVRALLCPDCNRAVGALEKMNGLWLGPAQAYLSQFREKSVLEIGLWRANFSGDAE